MFVVKQITKLYVFLPVQNLLQTNKSTNQNLFEFSSLRRYSKGFHRSLNIQQKQNHFQPKNFHITPTTKMVNSDDVTYLDIPDKSENDKKQYKTLALGNGLRALLVSDPSPVPHDGTTSTSSSYDSNGDSCAEESSSDDNNDESDGSTTSDESDTDSDYDEGNEKLAACAVLIDVGSFAEPPEYQGLAHFLEHMIFMGSEKYPAENAYDAHIKKCGGFDNANTDCEDTLFYFEVSEEHLDTSMDLFTALLKSPLMLKDAMERERDSVESEFQQTVHDDEVRRDQLLASLAAPNYPHSTFTWGNLKTLKENVDDDVLHKQLHEFRKRHYSANRMFMCVQARLPIEELETLVVKHFSDIPFNGLSGLDMKLYDYHSAFIDDFSKKVFYVKPVENVCKLELTWVLPPMSKLYRFKPDHFMAHLMGYEGKGSLCAYLRRRLWALDLISGINESGFDSNSMYTLFNLCIFLTLDGYNHLEEVLAATFAYIKLFTHCGSLKDIYEELQRIEASNFRFQPQRAAFDNVQDLVTGLKYYPPKDVLTGSQLYFEYNEEQIQNVIRHLNEFKFNIMITTQEKVDYDRKEKWFGTDYKTIDMPEKWQQLWNESQPIAELHLPEPNPFISNIFTIFWHENSKPDLPQEPKKILQNDVGELWFRQDDKFELPEAYMYFYFISPLLRKNPKNDVMCALYVQLVKFQLNEALFPATIAGLNYQFDAAEKGVVLKVSGYNEKLHLIVNVFTKTMATISKYITENLFSVYKLHQKKTYFNALIKPKTLNKDIRLCILENIRWPMIDKYKCLNDITLADMLEFSDNFVKELYVQTLMQGNLTEESAHNVMNSVLSTLDCHKIRETKYIENRVVQLPQGVHFIRCHALNDKDVNTYICNFYQIGPCSVRIESILDLLMMFVEEPLFDTLRTKEQLGYYVAATVRVNCGIAGYSITVNSQESKFSATHVEDRIEVFRGTMLHILEKMSFEEFDHVRDSLIKLKQVVFMSLSEEVLRNWSEITCEEYLFDRRRKEIDVLRTLTKDEIIDFCLNNERTNLRKISVQVIGNKLSSPTPPVSEISSPTHKILSKDEVNAKAHQAFENDDSSENDDSNNEVANDELFNALSNKLTLCFIPKDGDAATITDINDFKENLHVFPITKTKLESSAISDERRTIGPISEIIEDC